MEQEQALRPAESMALTVALAQVLRGEDPMPNVATVCVLALARLTDRYDYEDSKQVPNTNQLET